MTCTHRRIKYDKSRVTSVKNKALVAWIMNRNPSNMFVHLHWLQVGGEGGGRFI